MASRHDPCPCRGSGPDNRACPWRSSPSMEIGVSRAPPESGSRNTSHTPGRCKFENRASFQLLRDSIFSDVCLVGAAGFEPATCSTQNCRATRLRYTPFILGSDVDTRLNPRPARRSPAGAPIAPLNSGWATRSPGLIPYFCAVPAITSRTPLAGPAGGNDLSTAARYSRRSAGCGRRRG